mmetsp:Transcript_79232/g.190143  ORF Transcript_79232/g.190143 Transcript_79232/m.190143 type:complete len:97 (+) Transcript_79232:32-322(+)|eukprot:CAMPEP_0181450012 /NCGR_PEP_ID=MMETSP1110-20121109/27958_1 /TAXON_ID=174948 /ORGANISM="Symbiodinium sp., Strain CCMP421" /LENGTH=96 /DNA_ID=CAMNT_0023574223 /DNA_START=31 /DNA_END=321 /DNA_ORIENTATION=-
MAAPAPVAEPEVALTDQAIEDLLQDAATAWCTPQEKDSSSWQEFVKLVEKPSIDWAKGVARAKFEYLDRDQVLCSVDCATVEYDIKAGKVIGIKLG